MSKEIAETPRAPLEERDQQAPPEAPGKKKKAARNPFRHRRVSKNREFYPRTTPSLSSSKREAEGNHRAQRQKEQKGRAKASRAKSERVQLAYTAATREEE